MDKDRFIELATKYLTDTANASEMSELNQYLEQESYRKLMDWLQIRFDAANMPPQAEFSVENNWTNIADRIRKVEPEFERSLELTPKIHGMRRYAYGVAAAIALLVVSGGILLWLNRSNIKTNQVNTNRMLASWEVAMGEPASQFILPDSSQVWLNSGSKLNTLSAPRDSIRAYQLEGEGFFEVSHDSLRPFIVTTGTIQTKVLGTSFQITAYPEEDLSIGVATGKVGVEDLKKNKYEVLIPGNQLIIVAKDNAWTKREDYDIKMSKWREGILWFNNSLLSDVIPKFERRFGYSFEIVNPKITHCRLYGELNVKDISGLLLGLKQLYDIDYEYNKETGTVSLYGNDCK